jgi:D-sedoheptulose 7-phosphate isomerase
VEIHSQAKWPEAIEGHAGVVCRSRFLVRFTFMSNLSKDLLTAAIGDSIRVKQAVLEQMLEEIATAAGWVTETLRRGNKLLLFGNGGSAADAQHIAAEFIGRFERERDALPAIALTTDTSILTALTNDYSGEVIFARQVEALGQPGDLVLAYSTSGNSPNVLAGISAAQRKGLRVVGLTGEGGGKMAELCDLILRVPSRRTSRIQEAHITISHALSEVVEADLFVD